MSGSGGAKGPTQAEERQRLAQELADLLDEVVFNLEHGVPLSVIHKMEALGRKLEAFSLVEISASGSRLKEEIAALQKDLGEILADRDAARQLIDRGQRIVTLLQEGR